MADKPAGNRSRRRQRDSPNLRHASTAARGDKPIYRVGPHEPGGDKTETGQDFGTAVADNGREVNRRDGSPSIRDD